MADDSLSKPVDAIKCKEIIDQLLREKFTIEHYWNGLTSIFQAEGVSQQEIEKIEHKVARAIKGRNSKKLIEAIESVALRGEILAKAVIIGQKLLTLFGSN
jgi:transcriptional regulator NrdR family protein